LRRLRERLLDFCTATVAPAYPGGPKTAPHALRFTRYPHPGSASLLIHDCQYTEYREYREHHGWGHCPVSDALDFGRRTGAKRMLLFHHDPMHSDDFLDGMRDDIARNWEQGGGDPGDVELAAERSQLEVIEPASRPAQHVA
jgi:hypothetical protein